MVQSTYTYITHNTHHTRQRPPQPMNTSEPCVCVVCVFACVARRSLAAKNLIFKVFEPFLASASAKRKHAVFAGRSGADQRAFVLVCTYVRLQSGVFVWCVCVLTSHTNSCCAGFHYWLLLLPGLATVGFAYSSKWIF